MPAGMIAEELKAAEKAQAIELPDQELKKVAEPEEHPPSPARRILFFIFATAWVWIFGLLFVSNMLTPSALIDDTESPAPLKVLVLPTSELLDQPATNASKGSLTITRAHFSELIGAGDARKHVIAAFVDITVTSPLDLLPNIDDATPFNAPPSSPSPPPPPSSPSPPPPSPSPPSPGRPTPSWVLESRLPPRPKLPTRTNATLPADDAPGAWAYEVLDPRPGTVLLATSSPPSPRSSQQPYFDDAVVLLVRTCGCHPNIFGVLLSSPPSNLTVGQTMCPVARRYYHSFIDAHVHVGGPAGPHWTVLHDQPLAGSVEVAPNVRVGGCLAQAQAKVDAGTANASEVCGTWFALPTSAPIREPFIYLCAHARTVPHATHTAPHHSFTLDWPACAVLLLLWLCRVADCAPRSRGGRRQVAGCQGFE